MTTTDNCVAISEINNPINDSLYCDEIQDKLFLGFHILSNYDHLRLQIPDKYNPIRIKTNGNYFYGIWVEGEILADSDEVVVFKLIADNIFSLTFNEHKHIIKEKYRNFDKEVYEQSQVPFYHKLAQIYICIFLP